MEFYVGIDGGGTKTKIRIMNEAFENIDSLIGGASNISSLGKEIVKKNMESIFNELLKRNNLDIELCISLCIGSAGVDRDKQRIEMEEIFIELGFKTVKVVNDTKIVLATESLAGEGIVVISGTGSIVYGMTKTESERAGGWGYLLGDEGSGYWIGYEAIKAVLNAHDNVIGETSLSKRIMKELNIIEVNEFIERVYVKKDISKLDISSLARIVDEEANNGDVTSKDILYRGSEELAKRVKPVYEKLFKGYENVDVVLNGSVINNSKYFNENFMSKVNEFGNCFTFKPISKDPSYGACYLNKEM